jgi:uncharacterized protein (TIGR02391 family)
MFLFGSTLDKVSALSVAISEMRVNNLYFMLERDSKSPFKKADATDIRALDLLLTNVNKAESALVELIALYEGTGPELLLRKVEKALDNVHKVLDDLMDYYKSFKPRPFHEVMFTPKRSDQEPLFEALWKKIEDMHDAMEKAIDGLVDHAHALMPVPLSPTMAKHIYYEQLRRSPQAATQHSFAVFEQYLRGKIGAGPEVYGEELINRAFAKNGSISYSQLPAEQLGIRNFVSGAYATLRNPRMHRVLDDDEDTALAIIALLSLIMRLVDEASGTGIGSGTETT